MLIETTNADRARCLRRAIEISTLIAATSSDDQRIELSALVLVAAGMAIQLIGARLTPALAADLYALHDATAEAWHSLLADHFNAPADPETEKRLKEHEGAVAALQKQVQTLKAKVARNTKRGNPAGAAVPALAQDTAGLERKLKDYAGLK